MWQKNLARPQQNICRTHQKSPAQCRASIYRMELAADAARGQTNLFQFQIFRCALAAVLNDLVLNILAFIERAQPGPLDRGDVHEHILAAALRLDKAVTLGRVEPLHRACSHARSPD